MRAISPVIATVIIVSVAIAISIAVALWLTGVTSGFTQTENLQIVSSYATAVTNPDNGWNVTIVLKNTGTVAATIDNIFINGIPISNAQGVSWYNGTGTTIDPGKNVTIVIVLKQGTFSPGQMVNIKIHTASGRDYPTTVTLP